MIKTLTAILLTGAVWLSAEPAQGQTLADRVTEFRLDNGMLFLLVPQPDQAPTFAGTIMVKVGGVDEPLGQTGLAHMFEHMAFKGTPWIGTRDFDAEREILEQIDNVAVAYTESLASIPGRNRAPLNALEMRTSNALRQSDDAPADIDAAIIEALSDTLRTSGDRYPGLDRYVQAKRLYAKMKALSEEHAQYSVKDEFSQIIAVNGGVGLNAGTGRDYTIYYVQFPSNRLELWAMLESQRFLYPVMREFYSERDVVIEERRMNTEDDPTGKLYENFVATAMLAHPYSRPTIGWMSDIEQATAEAADEFRKRYYVPENTVGVLVGNFDVDEAKTILSKYFGRIPLAEQHVPRIGTEEPEQPGERRITVEFDAEPQVMIGFHKPNYPEPEAYIFSVIANILRDSGQSSRLYEGLVKTGIASSVNVYEEIPGQRYPNLFVIHASPIAPNSTADIEREVYRILEELASDLVPETELQKAKNQIRARYVRSLTDNAYLAQKLAHAQLINGDWKLLTKHASIVSDVTPEQIRGVARQYFRASNRTVGTLVRPDTEVQ